MPALPLEPRNEQIAARIRNVLASINHESEPAEWWHTPDRVVRVDDFLIDHLRKEFRTVYQVRPGDEFIRELSAKQIDRDQEVRVLGARSYSWPVRNAHFGNEKLAEGTLTDVAGTRELAILSQPRDPAPLRLLVTKSSGALTGTAAAVGLDHSGAPLTVTFNLASGYEQLASDALASVSSVSLTDVVGATSGDSILLEWFLTKWTVQNRLVRDITKMLGSDIRLGGLTYNLEIPDFSWDFEIEVSGCAWAVVEARVIARYRHHAGHP